MHNQAQSSVEFLLIVGFSLLMIVPATVLFLNYSSDSQDAVHNAQVFQVGKDIALTAELVYGVGEGSWQTMDLSIPDVVESITVFQGAPADMSELVIDYGESTVVLFTSVPLVTQGNTDCTYAFTSGAGCTLPVHPGENQIRVESRLIGTLPAIRLQVIS